MTKKLLLALLTLSAGFVRNVSADFDWSAQADELLVSLSHITPRFNDDIVVYNDLTAHVVNLRTMLANNAASVTAAFAALSTQAEEIRTARDQVVSDTNASAAAAVQAKLLLQGQLAAIISSTDAQIATLNQEITDLTMQRDELVTAYNSMVGVATNRATELMDGVRSVSDAYNNMISAKTAFLTQVQGLNADAQALFAAVSAGTTPTAPAV